MSNYLKIILLVFIGNQLIFPCTTGIVSGKYTKDGRPILWKHRDTSYEDNKIIYFTDGKYKYMGLVNSEDKNNEAVWTGVNEAGFSIMNSASYNLIDNDSIKLVDQEGILMKKALQNCATLEDFEELLKTLPKPLGVQANFGVIDAKGGAAYYETDQFSFVKIDVNDSKVAPFGYVIRTNYSFTGDPETGYGYIRYNTANELFYNATAENNLTPEFMLSKVSRSLKHSLMGIDLNNYQHPTPYVAFQDYIPRTSSVAVIVVEGVRKGENPNLTTMWSIVGFPLTTVVVPLWLAAEDNFPDIIKENEQGLSSICTNGIKLKNNCFPIKRGNGSNYIKLDELINDSNTGILNKVLNIESKIITDTRKKLSEWREKGINKAEILDYYKDIDKYLKLEYKENFGL